jgi:hypothetical protein
MESSSLSFSYTRIQAYASTAGPTKALSASGAEAASSGKPRHCDGQSKDGDSFTLSLEARILQVSISQTDDGASLEAGTGQQGTDNGSGLVKALMQAVKDAFGQSGDSGVDDGSKALEGRGRHGHHHPMRDPQDVADRALKHLQSDYAQNGGDMRDFIDEVKKRMAARGAPGKGYGHDGDFRNQVNTLVSQGLDDWMKGGSASANA